MLAWLTPDGRRLLAARVTRSFGYGFLAVALGVYLEEQGYGGVETGLVLTVALVFSAAVVWAQLPTAPERSNTARRACRPVRGRR